MMSNEEGVELEHCVPTMMETTLSVDEQKFVVSAIYGKGQVSERG